MSNYREIRTLMRSDIRQSDPGIGKKSKATPTKLQGLSRKQITVGKTVFKGGLRVAEVKGVAKHANRVLGYLCYDEAGGVWRFRKVAWARWSVEAHKNKNGAAVLLAAQL